MTNVVHIITDLDSGGAEQQLTTLITNWSNKDIQHQVICLSAPGIHSETLTRHGIKVTHLHTTNLNSLWLIFHLYQALIRLTPRPHIAVTWLFHADFFGRLTTKLSGIPVLISNQRSSLVGRSYLWLLCYLTKYPVDHYIVQSSFRFEKLRRILNLEPSKISIIPNAVDTNIFYPLKRPYKPNPLTITCVSNLRPYKGHHELLEAFALLVSRYPNKNFKLQLVGSGPLQQKLFIRCQRLNISNLVSFLGTRSDIPFILQKSDIFVFPSHGEGMSNALLEALACGLPTITSDIPANLSLIKPGFSALAYHVGSFSSLYASLDTLIKDNGLRIRLSRQARNMVLKNNSLASIILIWEKILLEIKYA